MEKIKFRPLDKVLKLVIPTGLEITYAYEDLAFSEHSVFVFRFDENDQNLLHLYFNTDCEFKTAKKIKKILHDEAPKQNLKILNAGKFNLTPIDGKEEFNIEFLK